MRRVCNWCAEPHPMGLKCRRCGSVHTYDLPNGSYACAACDYVGNASLVTDAMCDDAYRRHLRENGLSDETIVRSKATDRRGSNGITAAILIGVASAIAGIVYAFWMTWEASR